MLGTMGNIKMGTIWYLLSKIFKSDIGSMSYSEMTMKNGNTWKALFREWMNAQMNGLHMQ